MQDPKHHFLENGDIYAKEITLATDEFVVQHVHDYDHFGVLLSGRAVLLLDGVAGRILEPGIVPILRGVQHSIRALAPCVWYCIHCTEEKDHAKVDSTLISKES